MNSFWQDMRYAARMLGRRPGLTIAAVATLALGLGANIAVFSFANALLLRPLPLPEPDRLVRLLATSKERRFDVFSYLNYADLRDRNQVFAQLAAHQDVTVGFSAGEQPEAVRAELVTGNYFATFGMGAVLGRPLQPDDDRVPGGHPVAVVSHSFWKRRFGSDSGLVGRTIQLNAHAFTVVGVAPEGFNGSYQAYATDIWVPMMMHEQVRPRSVALSQRGWGWLRGTGRLKPAVTLEQARADLGRLAQQLRQEFPKLNEGLGFEIYPAGVLPEEFRAGAAKFLGFFQGVVLLVLLVACANIASMLLAQAVGRQQEVAIRQALGATRERLVRQCLTESLLLALLSGAAGLLVAMWAQSALLGLAPPLEELSTFSPNLGLDARALGFVFLISVVTGLLFGTLPALRATGTDLVSALKEEAGSTAGGRSRARLQRAFIVGQVAVSLLLLVTAGLLLRTLAEARAFDPGFNTKNVLVADVPLRRYGYDGARARAFYQEAIGRLQSLPGVRSVSFSTSVPLGGGQDVLGFRIPGHEPSPEKPLVSIDVNLVGPNYFSTMGIPMLRGRDFRPDDSQPGAPGVAVINQTMAQRFWPATDPIGQRIQLGSAGPWLEIVGVVRDIKYYSLAEEPLPFIYGSVAPSIGFGAVSLLVLTEGDSPAVLPAVREHLAALEPGLATAMVVSLDELRLQPLLPQRVLGALTGLFAVLALALSAVGLYGLLSYLVAQRRREIGLRLALGAQPRDILRLVIGQGLVLTLVGIGVGLAGAFVLTRFLRTLLFGVTPTDPITFVAVSGLLTVVGLLACYLPARRAMRVDPMVALRYE